MAQSERAMAQTRVQALQEELDRLRESQRSTASGLLRASRLRASELQQAAFRQAWFEEQCERLSRRLQEASLTLQEKDRALRLAQREYRKFQLLRDRRKKTWSDLQERLLQKQLDEVASVTCFRAGDRS